MVRAVLENGEIRPLTPLPADWSDGQVLLIEVEVGEGVQKVSAWAQEIEEAAKAIPDEEHLKFLEALAEQKRASKEHVRRDFEALPQIRTENWT